MELPHKKALDDSIIPHATCDFQCKVRMRADPPFIFVQVIQTSFKQEGGKIVTCWRDAGLGQCPTTVCISAHSGETAGHKLPEQCIALPSKKDMCWTGLKSTQISAQVAKSVSMPGSGDHSVVRATDDRSIRARRTRNGTRSRSRVRAAAGKTRGGQARAPVGPDCGQAHRPGFARNAHAHRGSRVSR
eukprot:358499-Chlamydomonas_euryale.AAC.4